MQPLVSFYNQVKEEVEAYEGIKRGHLGTLNDDGYASRVIHLFDGQIVTEKMQQGF